MTVFVGVDGGLSGAIAFFDPETNRLRVHPVPVVIQKIRGKTRSFVDDLALNGLLAAELGSETDIIARVESGIGDRRQSSSAAYNYGLTNGAVWMALRVRLGEAAQFVHPTVWKRYLGLIGTDKAASVRKAQRAFPAVAHLWIKPGSRKAAPLDHNAAEAALIALYASKAHG